MKIDEKFSDYFKGRLKQVFFYITDVCQLRCEQCLYKTTLANREMELSIALKMLEIFKEYGATKLTFIGGEPTLYGRKLKNRPLFEVINTAVKLGYEYIRLDTNGQFKENLLLNESFKKLNNLAFSLDGHNAEINDLLRGKGTFDKCTRMAKKATDSGYYTTITACIHPKNINHIDEMIDLACHLGVREFNMHPLFKMGIDRDQFSGDTDISPAQWMGTYKKIKLKIEKGDYSIPIRIPQRFVKTSEYNLNPDSYNYCPVKMGERILVHPDGKVRICALCIGSPYHIANYSKEQIQLLDTSLASEINSNRTLRKPCMSQIKNFGELTPLCISYKPFQHEHVWRTNHFDEKYSLNNTYNSAQIFSTSKEF